MRPFNPPVLSALVPRLVTACVIAAGLALTTIHAQIPGRNVNMVAGTSYPNGDPFLQRQNEPSLAASTRNPLHLLAGSNDYRTVDVPFPADADVETGDAWLGLFKSFDGGQRWSSGLLPGYPQDESEAGLKSPLKAYQAGADPVVRAGTHGLLYYSGLVFDRVENGKSAIFVSRFIDNNNNENGDSIAYLGASLVATSSGTAFLDKPWMAVDIPRPGAATCVITTNSMPATSFEDKWKKTKLGLLEWWWWWWKHKQTPPRGQRIPAGAVYVAYSSITGEGATLKSEILLKRSTDCGRSWSPPIRVSRPDDRINQGASIAIEPRFGSVYIAWRRFTGSASAPGTVDLDAMMVARLPYGGSKFDPPGQAHGFSKAIGRKVSRKLDDLFEHRGKKYGKKTKVEEAADVAEFDQGSSPFSFRTNAYPTLAADGTGRIYLAWTQRGFPAPHSTTNPFDGARIMMVTTRDGRSFTAPQAVDDYGQAGHQVMPSLAFAGGRLMLVYYDLRETRADHHGRFASDHQTNTGKRHTMDIRAAMAAPGDHPQFAPSVKVSEYLMGYNPATNVVQQLQVNPPNLPMFRQGTTPFMGDYIDIAAAPAFVPAGNGRWAYNTGAAGNLPVFHAAWTDNRDVRPPTGKPADWTKYTPVNLSKDQGQRFSKYDGSVVPACEPGNAGSRNQNIYTARVTGGLLAGSPGNTKPLSPTLQRAFVVFATNATDQRRSFRMSIRNQPPGGRASFEQFDNGQPPLTVLDMSVPARSTASRSMYVTSTDPDATIAVDVFEIPNGEVPPLGLASTVLINPDIENPDIENPDVENRELYNPDIENPDVENPDVENIGVATPDIENPDVENPDVENPDVENVLVINPDIENPDIENPDVENPDIENPDVENPDVENQAVGDGEVADVTWKVSNQGNTTSAFNVNLFLASEQIPAGVKTQLILFKTYRTPVGTPNGCQLGFQVQNVLVSNILNPDFVLPGDTGVPDQNASSDKNATMWLGPGEEGRITLRVIFDDLPPNLVTTVNGDFIPVAFLPQNVTPAISSQGVGTDDKAAGRTEPELKTPTGANLFYLQQPSDAQVGEPISPPVVVQVRDNVRGTPVPGAMVTLALGNNPGQATLTGHTALSDETGRAVFANLRVNTAGNGFTLIATAAGAGVQASAESIAFDVSEPLQVVATELPVGTAGTPYEAALQSSGGVGMARSWSLVGESSLPPGLTLSPSGAIAGDVSPLARGDYSFMVRVSDAQVPPHTATHTFTISIAAQIDLSVAVIDAPDPVAVGADLTYTITVSNGGPSTATGVTITSTFSAAIGFVSGDEGCEPGEGGVACTAGALGPGDTTHLTLIVKAGHPGVLTHTAVVSAAELDPLPDGNTAVATTEVFQPLAIEVPPPNERTAQMNVPYALALTAIGGDKPYTWSVVNGELPPGLSLNASTGVIAGTVTPPAVVAYTFTIRVDDAGGRHDTQLLCIEVETPEQRAVTITPVGETLTIEDLVENYLFGRGVSIVPGSIEVRAAPNAAGTFAGAAGVLGIDSGIVLSSGDVRFAPGPNTSDVQTTGGFPLIDADGDPETEELTGDPVHGDSDLTELAGQQTYDATVLEFKFVPTGNQVRFRYVFASEEYNEWVASAYNDTFAFFITGPNGEKRNWALVPGSDQAVAINSINGGIPLGSENASNPELYRNNDPSDGDPTINIQADGLTVVLTLIADVTPRAEHTMKLAVADAGDWQFDSWVFIEAESFNGIENCNNGIDDDGDGLADGADPDCAVCPDIENPDQENPDPEDQELRNPELDNPSGSGLKPPGGLAAVEPLGHDLVEVLHPGEEVERRPFIQRDRGGFARPARRRVDL